MCHIWLFFMFLAPLWLAAQNPELTAITTADIDSLYDVPSMRVTLYQPGDYNPKNYRIPAIITAGEGSLVVATDKHRYNDGMNYSMVFYNFSIDWLLEKYQK
jgi:hypothetical protein